MILSSYLYSKRALILTALVAIVFSFAVPIATAADPGRPGEPVPLDSAEIAIARKLFARDNLVAWCVVPFDSKKRTPVERAAMLERLGFKRFAYDWRAEHVPTFEAETIALAEKRIALEGFWLFPGELTPDAKLILDLFKRKNIKTTLWVLLDMGGDSPAGIERTRRVEAAAAKLAPLAIEAAKIDCRIALYNHGGWFGEPENQVDIIKKLHEQKITNVGVVYNLHHGHAHVDRFAEVLKLLKPYLVAVNLNGMSKRANPGGEQILPLGQGELDLELLRTIVKSGYTGPIGILGHTMDDAEERLRDNLDGLDWLLKRLEGKPAGPPPIPRTFKPRGAAEAAAANDRGKAASAIDSRKLAATAPLVEQNHNKPKSNSQRMNRFDRPDAIAEILRSARSEGDAVRGAEAFASPKFACLSCHKIAGRGGEIGPELTTVGGCVPHDEIVESIVFPARRVKEGYRVVSVATADGKTVQGFHQAETSEELVVRDLVTLKPTRILKKDIEEIQDKGTPMPEGVAEAMTDAELRDLVRFLIDLGKTTGRDVAALLEPAHVESTFPFDRAPLRPADHPYWRENVNRDRVYDFYAKEAEYYLHQSKLPRVVPPYPGLDGGKFGHWGNQNEDVWADDRWNKTDLGVLMCGVLHAPGIVVPKGVCVRIGDRGEASVCFNPETLSYEALWRGGFVKFSATRHGFLDGLIADGELDPLPKASKLNQPFLYHGFYRNGNRVIFSYRIGDDEMLDSPWIEGGRFKRIVARADEHPLASLVRGGSNEPPVVIETRGKLGSGKPYAIDTIVLPFQNPWNAPLFFGDLDFDANGSAYVCTMQGDVWRVDGLDDKLAHVRWRRFATGLHQALGLVVRDGSPYVLGRDQITRLKDFDGDGRADFYECISNAYVTSPSGHDFINGLQTDKAGNFYTASSKQGILRISADGAKANVLATGLRNPDGLGIDPSGTITAPNSEGEWVPSSMVCEIKPGGHYGYGGPRDGRTPDLPLAYLPRGFDNSSGGQTYVSSDRFGPLKGLTIHYSYGTGSCYLLLREHIDDQAQGTIVPFPGEFRSGCHRGRFNPVDGALYVCGMGGWGTYTIEDGCFERVRYTGDRVQTPIATRVHQNGIEVEFSAPVDRSIAETVSNQFAQVWNYRYSAGYGSEEYSPSHPGTPGHDPIAIASIHVLADGKTVFYEIPSIQPVNQLHLHLKVDSSDPIDAILTVHKLGSPFTNYPGYRPLAKTIAAHPILVDLATARASASNRWRRKIGGAREVRIVAGKNLSYETRTFTVAPGEAIQLTLENPDAVPHNWALVKPGTLAKVGDLANKFVSDPEALARQYVPKSEDVIVYTDIAYPRNSFSIYFHAPSQPGSYPYLCTFPGHWMVMNGVMTVERPTAGSGSKPATAAGAPSRGGSAAGIER